MKDNVAPAPAKVGAVDIEAFANNLARMVEQGGKALAAYMKPREEGQVAGRPVRRDDRHGQDARARSASYWLSDPQPRGRIAVEPRPGLSRSLGRRGQAHVRRSSRPRGRARPEGPALRRSGMVVEPVLRFPQAGLSAHAPTGPTTWSTDAKDLDPHTRQKAEFYVKQVANALSPSNFVLTNPELLRETLGSNAENLARGMHMLAEDIEAGGGDLQIRQSDAAQVRGRPQSRDHARQGDLRERPDAAHPVRAVDAEAC